MEDIELAVSVPGMPVGTFEPPPAYSSIYAEGPNAAGTRQLTTGSYLFAMATSVWNRRPCSNPPHGVYRGCCRSCAGSLLLSLFTIIFRVLMTTLCVGMLGQLAGGKFNSVVVAVSVFLLSTLRFSFRISEIAGCASRLAQVILWLAAAIMLEILTYSKSGPLFLRNMSIGAHRTLQVLSITAIALSSAVGSIEMSYCYDCFWCGPEELWRIACVVMTLFSTIGAVCGMLCPERSISRILVFAAMVGAMLLPRPVGDAFHRTCVFRHYRLRSVGSLRPLGSARCRLTDVGHPDSPRTITEDQMRFCIAVGGAIMEVFMIMLTVLLGPVVVAIFRASSPFTQKVEYVDVVVYCMLSAFCGVLIGVAFGPSKSRRPAQRTCVTLVAIVIMAVGLLLTICSHTEGPAIYILGSAIAAMETLSVVRQRCKGIYLLPASCVTRWLFHSILFCSPMCASGAWIADTYYPSNKPSEIIKLGTIG